MSEVNNQDQNDSNFSGDIEAGLKEVISVITSIIAMCAAIYEAFTNLTNAMYAHKAESFYNVSSELFYYDRNFDFIISIFILIFTYFVLIMPFYLSDKWKSKNIDRIEALLFSALISLYILAILVIVLTNFIVRMFAHRNLIFLKIFIIVVFILLTLFFYFIITGTSKRTSKKNNGSGIINDIKNDLSIVKLSKVQKIVYPVYVIIFFVVIFSLKSLLSSPGIDPKYKMSYEILKDEKAYNVIIGYKDDMAITMTSEKAGDPDNQILRFESNEYKLQDLKDKVIIYKTFEEVVTIEGSTNNKVSNESVDKSGD